MKIEYAVHTVHYSIIMGWQKIVIQYIFNNIIKGTVSQDFWQFCIKKLYLALYVQLYIVHIVHCTSKMFFFFCYLKDIRKNSYSWK